MEYEFYFERLGFIILTKKFETFEEARDFAIEFEAMKFRKVGEDNWIPVYRYEDGVFNLVYNFKDNSDFS